MSAELEKKLQSIESRILNIENRLEIEYTENPHVIVNSADSNSIKPSSKEQANISKTSSFIGSTEKWLGVVAVVCFVLAAGFIIKLSIDSGWVTNERRIGLSVILGLSLVTCGVWFLESGPGYSGFLAAGGIIVLYSSNFAAFQYYSLISFQLAIASASVISGLCLWIYMKTKHPIYAITASVGSYISPVLLSLNTISEFSLYYFVMCSVTFSLVSIWLQARLLVIISSYFAIFMSAIIGLKINQDLFISVILAIHFIVFASGGYLYTKYNNSPLRELEANSFIPVLLLFYAMEYYFINKVYPGLAPWISLSFAGFLIGLYLLAKKYSLAGSGGGSLVVTFSTIVLFHSLYMNLIPDYLTSWILVVFMLIIACDPSRLIKKPDSQIFQVPFVAVMLILIIEYISIVSNLFDSKGVRSQLLAFAAFTSFWIVIIRANQSLLGNTILFAAHLLAIIGLYRLTEDINSFVVSALWLFYALCVIGFGFLKQDKIMARSALFVLVFAAGKVLLYDAAHAPTILRISCLLLTGVVFYACGILLGKISAFTSYENNNGLS